MKIIYVSPLILPIHVSPLYSAKVFDILKRHTMLIEFTDLQVLRFDKVN